MSYFYDKLLFRTNFYEDVALMFIFLSLLPARSSETKQHKKQLCSVQRCYSINWDNFESRFPFLTLPRGVRWNRLYLFKENLLILSI